MALTIVQAETILIRRCGALMTQAGLDGSTVDGNNTDLVDPIGWALRQLGYTPTNILDIVDADLADVTTIDKLFDFAEYRLLQNISGNLTDTTLKVGPRSENFSDLLPIVEKRLDRKRMQIEQDYGFSKPFLFAGV